MDGLADEQVDRYLEEHPKIVPLFEVDITEAVIPYVTNQGKESDKPDQEVIREFRQAQEALEREMTISQRLKAYLFEEVDLGTNEKPTPVNMAKEMPRDEKKVMVELLTNFRDVFT